MLVNCSECKKEYDKKIAQIKLYKNSYCSSKCRSLHTTKIVTLSCKVCKKEAQRKPSELKRINNVFCSSVCANYYNNLGRKNNYKDGKSTYRDRAIKKYGLICAVKDCPIRASGIVSTKKMFDVDHIDGRKKGHDIENLQVLCVWCHASKSRGNGRFV